MGYMPRSAHPIPVTTRLVVAAWVLLCGVGMWQLAEHAGSAGTTGNLMTRLTPTVAEQLNWSFDRKLLVLAAHPQCPCLAATLDELGHVLASDRTVAVRILVYEPSARPAEWDEDATEVFEGLPEDFVIADRDGQLALALGAETSGHICAYQPNGEWIFSGGITGSRGHRGDNQYRRALLDALTGNARTASRTPVFGCPLQTPCDCPE